MLKVEEVGAWHGHLIMLPCRIHVQRCDPHLIQGAETDLLGITCGMFLGAHTLSTPLKTLRHAMLSFGLYHTFWSGRKSETLIETVSV